jgi:hypothetical protein
LAIEDGGKTVAIAAERLGPGRVLLRKPSHCM